MEMVERHKGEAPRHWILRSKLEMPRNNARLVQRQRLIDKMDRWLDIDLGVVVGPAGFAKSTAITEWCRHQQGKGTTVAWLTLDEADREPAQFLSYLVASLSSAGVVPRGLIACAEEGFFAGGLSTALTALLNAVHEKSEPVVLVLDDYHRTNSPKVDELTRALLAAQPANLTTVIATRTPLPFDIGALLAAGRADELGTEALRFTKDELVSLFPPGVSEGAVSLLYDRTEGWPVAVQLAKLLVIDTPAQTPLENLHGHTGHIATYLADQIVGGLPSELQDFLCFTSPLERFNSPLAAAVTRNPSVDRMIEQLEPLNALVVRADGKDTSYRYHHLFAEFLQTQLRHRHGEEALVNVHRRASVWFEKNGYMAEAVKHAREAGDFDRCASLVETAGGWELILFGGIGYLRGLLQQISEDVARQNPRVLLAKAYLAVKDGLLAEARALLDIARQATETTVPSESLQRDILNVGTLISVYEDTPLSPSDSEVLERRIDAAPAADPLTRSILSCQLIVYELSWGQFAAADRRAQTTMRTMREARTVLGLNYCYLHAGLAAMYQGRLKTAEAHFGVARRMAEENFAFDPGLRALSRLLDGCLKHWMDEPIGHGVEQTRADLDQVEEYDGWFDIYAAGLTVEALLLQDTEGAIVRGARIAERRGLTRLTRMVDAMRLALTNDHCRSSLAFKLRQQLPDAVWREQSYWWLPFLESRLAIATYYGGVDRSKAIKALNDGLDCARAFGAMLHVVRSLVARALLHDLAGQRTRAVEDLVEALTIAASEGIVRPFIGQRGLIPLLRAVSRQAQESYIDILIIDFANVIMSRLSKESDEPGKSAGLSPREREVLEELANGRSNKEIARLLDMTEHTVKFHLKNVFAKLGAERRTEAVARARGLSVI